MACSARADDRLDGHRVRRAVGVPPDWAREVLAHLDLLADHRPSVGVVVPARGEAAVLPETLPTLLAQDYPGELAVWLVDDGSSDGTAALASTLAGAGQVAERAR